MWRSVCVMSYRGICACHEFDFYQVGRPTCACTIISSSHLKSVLWCFSMCGPSSFRSQAPLVIVGLLCSFFSRGTKIQRFVPASIVTVYDAFDLRCVLTLVKISFWCPHGARMHICEGSLSTVLMHNPASRLI